MLDHLIYCYIIKLDDQNYENQNQNCTIKNRVTKIDYLPKIENQNFN